MKEHCFEAGNMINKARYDVHGSSHEYYFENALKLKEKLRDRIHTQGFLLGVREIWDLRYDR